MALSLWVACRTASSSNSCCRCLLAALQPQQPAWCTSSRAACSDTTCSCYSTSVVCSHVPADAWYPRAHYCADCKRSPFCAGLSQPAVLAAAGCTRTTKQGWAARWHLCVGWHQVVTPAGKVACLGPWDVCMLVLDSTRGMCRVLRGAWRLQCLLWWSGKHGAAKGVLVLGCCGVYGEVVPEG